MKEPKESRATMACIYRTSGQFYMLQLISVDSKPFTQNSAFGSPIYMK